MTWLKKVGSFFAGLFTRDTADKIVKGIQAAAPYVEPALKVAQTIAALTPNRADDEIVAAARKYAAPLVWNPNGDRGTVLRDIAVLALQKQFPDAPKSDLVRAVELSVGALKAK